MHRRRAPLAMLVAVALSVAAGCGGDDDTSNEDAGSDPTTTTEAVDEDTTTTATATTQAAEDPAPPASREIAVELLDPGAEPRQELRLQVEEGSEQTYVFHQEQDTTIDAGGTTQRSAVSTEQEVTYAVDAIGGDGLIAVKTTYGAGRVLDDPPVDAATRDVLEQLLAAFEGGQGSATFDDRGAILELQAPDLDDLPSELGPALEVLIDGIEGQASQLATPFPEEAVGVGARWRISAAFELTGLPFEISTEVTLTAVDDESADAEVVTRMAIVPGPVDLQGTQAEVVSGELSGGGTVHWDRSTPLSSSDQELAGTVVISVDQAGTPVEIRQTLRQRTSIQPL